MISTRIKHVDLGEQDVEQVGQENERKVDSLDNVCIHFCMEHIANIRAQARNGER